MAKITYLIGAGASYNALPIVNDFPDKLLEIIRKLESMLVNIRNELSHTATIHSEYDKALSDLKLLYNGCINHMSVDTYAKMLFLTSSSIQGNEAKYNTTKWSIVLFFELYRYFNKQNSFDKRYDALLATILNTGSPMLPKNINVISWNYDYEFEKAFTKYYPTTTSIEDVYSEMNVIHKNHSNNRKILSNFGIVKINGTSGYYDQNGNIHLGLGNIGLFLGDSQNDFMRLLPIIQAYLNLAYHEQLKPAISFSWENDTTNQKIIDDVKTALEGTESLIIIGYSFPNFNRIIDKEIIETFNSNRNPAYIYIQDPDAENIINRIKDFNIFRYRYKAISDTKQFYLPPEF